MSTAAAAAESTRASTRWITRLIPIFLAAAIGYSTYVIVARICAQHFIRSRSNSGAAIAILVLWFAFLLLSAATYLRTILTIWYDPDTVALGPLAVERRKHEQEEQKRNKKKNHGWPWNKESLQQENGLGDSGLQSRAYYTGPDPDPDSPGLEQFYTKDAFVCESDGRPKYCSECCNWKADRVHHSSEINRCVYRMDHFCPWVGGMIGENSFKFFVQFTGYATCLCAVGIGASAATVHQQLTKENRLDPFIIVVIVLGGFFSIFTSIMFGASARYAFLNMTNVDLLGSGSKVYQVAVRVPRGTRSTDSFTTVTYPLPKLELGINGEANSTPRLGGGHTTFISSVTGAGGRLNPRDELATRTFAILKTDPGENLWDVGYWRNWKAVMGTNIIDWLLPIRKSPCTDHDSHVSFYPMGHVLEMVRKRHGLEGLTADENGEMQMAEVRTNARVA